MKTPIFSQLRVAITKSFKVEVLMRRGATLSAGLKPTGPAGVVMSIATTEVR